MSAHTKFISISEPLCFLKEINWEWQKATARNKRDLSTDIIIIILINWNVYQLCLSEIWFFILLNVHNLHASWKLPEDLSHSISFQFLSMLSFYCYLWGRKNYLSFLLAFLVSFVISVLGKVKCCLPWNGDKCRSIMHLYLSTWALELSHFTASSTVPDYLNTAINYN